MTSVMFRGTFQALLPLGLVHPQILKRVKRFFGLCLLLVGGFVPAAKLLLFHIPPS